tara:strand:- start:6939 stop:7100 length:162 start_codon:yes stop_codon:yes gene_type:complete
MKISRRQLREILISEALKDPGSKEKIEKPKLSESEKTRLLIRKLLREAYKGSV